MLSFPVKFDRHHRPAPYPLSPYTLTLLHSQTSLFSYSYLLPKFSPFVFNHLRTEVGREGGGPSLGNCDSLRFNRDQPSKFQCSIAFIRRSLLTAHHCSTNSFRICTYKSSGINPFRISTYRKRGRGYHLWLTGTPEKHRSGWPAIDKPRFLN